MSVPVCSKAGFFVVVVVVVIFFLEQAKPHQWMEAAEVAGKGRLKAKACIIQ